LNVYSFSDLDMKFCQTQIQTIWMSLLTMNPFYGPFYYPRM